MSKAEFTEKDEILLLREKLDLLFSNNNSALPFYKDNGIVSRHNIIWDVLPLLECLSGENKRILQKCPHNSIALVKETIKKRPNNTNENILEYLILLAIEFSNSNANFADSILSVLVMLYKYNNLNKSHINAIYQKIAQQFYDEKINAQSIRFTLKLLQEIFGHQWPLSNEPQNFFYFSGSESGISVHQPDNQPWPFQNGFALSIWFYLDEANENILSYNTSGDSKGINKNFTGLPFPKLFTIHSQHNGGVEGYFIGCQLYFRNLPINYTEPTPTSNGCLLGEFKTNTWYYIGLEHERQKMFGKSHLNVVVNHEFKKSINIDFPRIPNNAVISRFKFGQDMIGRISSVILFKSPISQLKLLEIYSYFNHGLQINSQIKTIGLPLDKILDKILLLYTPIRASENQCYDVFRTFPGIMQQKTGFTTKEYSKQKLCFFGGISSLLPFFFVLRFCNQEEQGQSSLLNELLRLVILILKNKSDNQFEAARTNFFKIAGLLLSELTQNFFDNSTIELLAELKNSIVDPKLGEEFFVDFLWKIEIYEHADQEVREEMFLFIRTIYAQRPVYYNYLFSVEKILDMITDQFDSKNHHDLEAVESVSQKASPLIKIIEAILTTGNEEVSEGLSPLFKAFALKLSPKLHLLLFDMLKRIVIDRSQGNSYLANFYHKIMMERKVHENLLYLFSTTNSLEVKAMCLKFLNFIFTHKTSSETEDEIAYYLANLLKTSHKKHDNNALTSSESLLLKSEASQGKDNQNELKEEVLPNTHNLKNAKEIDIESRDTSASMSLAFNEEMTVEGNHFEKKLDVMSKNLRGNSKTFDFSNREAKTTKPLLGFSCTTQKDDENESELTLPVRHKKKDIKFPENGSISELAAEQPSSEDPIQPMAEPPAIKQTRKPGMKKNLFIVSDEQQPTIEPEQTQPTKPEPIPNDNNITGHQGNLTEEVEPATEVVFQPPKKTTKPSFKSKKQGMGRGLGLDIESINEDFTFGGEHGQKNIKNSDEEANKFIKEISDLAAECVQFMRGEKSEQDFYANKMPEIPVAETITTQDSTSEPYTAPDGYAFGVKSLRKKPEKGFKKPLMVDLPPDDSTNVESQPKPLEITEQRSNTQSLDDDTVQLQLPPRKQGQKPKLGSDVPTTQKESATQKEPTETLVVKKVSSIHVEESHPDSHYELFYQALVEWLLHKTPTNIDESIMIDDTEKIHSLSMIDVILEFYPTTNEFIKQKIIQDFYMLVKWNHANCQALLRIPHFHTFLLDSLYEYQYQLFNTEIKGVSAAIWELGSKLHTILLKFAVINDVDVQKRFQHLLAWMESKRINTVGKPNADRSEKSARFLVRHLWNHLLEALVELSYSSRPNLQTPYWRNIIYITFCTQEIVMNAYADSIMHVVNCEFSEKYYSSIFPYLTRASSDEIVPLNFKNAVEHTFWVDWKIVDSLIRCLDSLWLESQIPSRNTTESKEIDKKLSDLMDGVYSDDYRKLLQLFTHEPYQNSEPARGCFIKIIIMLVLCALEVACNNANLQRVTFLCSKIERIFKCYLVVAENCRDKSLLFSQRMQVLSISTYIMQFLYNLNFAKFSEEIRNEIRRTTCSNVIFLLSLLDFLNTRTGGSFDTYEGVKRRLSQEKNSLSLNSSVIESDSGFSFLTYDLIKSIFSANLPNPIITIPEIRQQKINNFHNVESIIFSQEWVEGVMDNQMVKSLIGEYFSESFVKINSEIFLFLQVIVDKIQAGSENASKRRVKIARRCEDGFYESAAKIHEIEDSRKHRIVAIEEEKLRIAKNLWTRVWRKLRIYTGQWKYPKFYDQRDEKYQALEWDQMLENKTFYHKISKFEIKSRARPFLKVKLIEPEYVTQYNERLEQKRAKKQLLAINPDIFPVLRLQNMYLPVENTSAVLMDKDSDKSFSFSQFGKDIRNSFSKAFTAKSPRSMNSADKNTPKERIGSRELRKISSDGWGVVQSLPMDEVILSKKAQWVKTLTVRNGVLQITSTKLVFILENIIQENSNIAFLAFTLMPDRRIFKEWPLENISEVQRRRYITRKTALEIFLIDGTSLLFNFQNGDGEEVSQHLTRLRKTRCPNLTFHSSLDPRKILEKSAVTKLWQNHKISNFEYLMTLNSLAGRSYKDLTQYHVFPWVLSEYSKEAVNLEDIFCFRDLKQPMGALGSMERTKAFQDRYENFDLFNPTPKFHFGSHYSSPAIILQFLIRLFPFSKGAKELQGGRFDLADRLFFSIEDSFNAATEEVSDVRELIPEFYCLPDFLINRERLDFGLMQTGQRVNHVRMPKWSKYNPYRFVTILRIALESDIVSKNLHNWIDLIFGYKQKGKEAENALNTFYYLTYEDQVDLDKIDDPATRSAIEAQTTHFGQTPSQLFTRPHPPRVLREALLSYKCIGDPNADIRVYRPSTRKAAPEHKVALSIFTIGQRGLIKLRFISETKLLGLRRDGTATFYRWWNSSSNSAISSNIPFSCGVEKEKAIQLERHRAEMTDNLDRSLKIENYPVVSLCDGKLLFCGGFWDGRMFMVSVDQDQVLESYYNHTDSVTVLVTDKRERYLISGSKCGECFMWKIAPDYKLILRHQFYDHEGLVTSVFISGDLRHFASAGLDGRINIYNLYSGNLLRTLYHPQNLPIHNVVLTSCPLPAIVFFSAEDRTLISYSINGQFLESIKEEASHILCPLVAKDINTTECLIYGNENGEVLIRELPFLSIRKRFTVSLHSPVLSLLLTEDKRYLLCGCGDGEISVLTDPNYTSYTVRESGGSPTFQQNRLSTSRTGSEASSPEKVEQ